MKRLWLLVGAPGSGKSTYLTQQRAANSAIVSRDLIRYSLVKENEPYFSKEPLVYRKLLEEAWSALTNSKITDVFIDQTSLTKASRAKLINALKARHAYWDELNALVFILPLQRTLNQNALRTGRERVPERQVIEMYNSLEAPTKKEGFNNLFVFDGKEWRKYG